MSFLTRIKNNQITDSTINANTKIVPGTIVGSLFNSNLTIQSDITITGNLTVQGASTYLAIASTNTYVNDPLILMNNSFSGTNTYDIGLLFNRGNQLSTAIIWNENNDEFALAYTTDPGTTYGQIDITTYADLHVGNIVVDGSANISSIELGGDINAANLTLSGDLAVNGGDITTTASTFNLLDANVTTMNFAGDTTSLSIGADSGNISINHANVWLPNTISLDGAEPSIDIFTQATNANLLTSASSITVGANSGTLTLANPTIVGSQPTQNLFDTGATTLNIGGDATTVSLGDSTGVLSLNNANIWMPNATQVHSGQTTVALFNDYATTVNFANAATAINIGATTGTLTINNPTVVGTQSIQNLYNTTTTTMNFAGAATALTIADVTGNTTIRNNLNVGLSIAARDINATVIGNVTPTEATFTTLTSQSTTTLGLTTATAINNTPIGNATPSTGSFTSLLASGITEITNTTSAPSLGTGAFRVSGGASVSGNLWVGGNINVVGNTYIISGNTAQFFGDENGFGALYAGITGFTALPQTVAQFAGDVNNYAQINFENVSTDAQSSTDYVATSGNGDDYNHYINMGIAGVNWDGSQENSLTNALYSNDGYLYVQGDNDSLGAGGNLVLGASTPNHYVKIVVGGNTAANISAVFGAPGTPSVSNTTGALVVTGGVGITGDLNAANLTITDNFNTYGNIDISSTAPSISTNTGALTVVGGAGIGGNLNIGENLIVDGNLTVNGTTTTLNTSTLEVEDLNITIAKGAANSAAADGAGIYVDGAAASITYTHSTTSWDFNKTIKGTAATLSNTDNTTSASTGALQVAGGIASAKDIFVGGTNLLSSSTTFNLLNSTVTDLNIGGAASAVNIGSSSGTLTINNPTVVGTQGTQNLYNTTATTINFAGAATTLTIGATTGTTTIRNALLDIDGNAAVGGTLVVTGDSTLTGDLAVNGGDITTTSSIFNLVDTTATTVNFAGSATNIDIGATSGLMSLLNANIWLPNATSLDGTQSAIGVFNNATTVDAFKAAADLEVGAPSGTLTINNPTVVGTQTTQNLYNTTATTVNFAGAATTVNIGADTGTATINNDIINLEGVVNINKTTASTNTTTGALVVDGGVGVAGNLHAASVSASTLFGTLQTPSQPNITSVGTLSSLAVSGNISAQRFISTLTALQAPTVGNYLGERLRLYDFNNTGKTNYAFGAESNHIWFGVDTNVEPQGFKWYGNTTQVMRLSAAGNLDISGTATIASNATIGGELTVDSITANSANILDSTSSISTTTGALTIAGGIGTGGNLNVAGGVTVNIDNTDFGFRVYGSSASTLIYADASSDTVTIGGSDPTPVGGVTLKVIGTDSMLLPLGTTADRPSLSGNVDVRGMLRYNTSLNYPEYYDGSQWKSAGSDTTFTVITSEQFNGDGANVAFTLSANSTTNSSIVAINGIVQIPVLSYDITGNQLTFTEAPDEGDIIEVRKLTTTQTLSDITSADGYNSFTPSTLHGAAIYSGTSIGTKKIRVSAKPDGTWAYVNGTKTTYEQTAVNIPSAGAPVVIDSFAASSYTTAKYIVQAKNGTNIDSQEAIVVTDGTGAYINFVANVNSGTVLGTLTANVVSGNVRLYYTSSSLTNSNIKVYTTYIV
jgi:hypothetical protein